MFKYTGIWIGNESRIMYNIYHTRTNRNEGYINPLMYIIIYCLSPYPSPPTTFNKLQQIINKGCVSFQGENIFLAPAHDWIHN